MFNVISESLYLSKGRTLKQYIWISSIKLVMQLWIHIITFCIEQMIADFFEFVSYLTNHVKTTKTIQINTW